MPPPVRFVVPILLYPLPGTHQTLCGPYFRDTLALRCFAWYTFVIPMRLYASLAILWRLSCLFGRYRFSLGSVLFPIGLSFESHSRIMASCCLSLGLARALLSSSALSCALLGSPGPPWALLGCPGPLLLSSPGLPWALLSCSGPFWALLVSSSGLS